MVKVICPRCGGMNTEIGTEENCDNVWCSECVDYTCDNPRLVKHPYARIIGNPFEMSFEFVGKLFQRSKS